MPIYKPEEVRRPKSRGKWIVLHDGARDHYQMPIALAEDRLLERFVTDWYTPMDNPFWLWISQLAFPGGSRKLSGRYSHQLPSSIVADSKSRYLFGSCLRRMTGRSYRDDLESKGAAQQAVHLANKLRCNLFATSYSASWAFPKLDADLQRVLFQVHPEPTALREIYQQLIRTSQDHAGLLLEQEMLVDERQLRSWACESGTAHHIICASNFTRRTLIEAGRSPDQISVVPYGVDVDKFPFAISSKGKKLKVLFVGQKVARKGLPMLLRVWSELRPKNAELIVAGGHTGDAALLARYAGIFTNVPQIGSRELLNLFQTADLFVLPSLAEGFGHVYLEALACGTPIICTQNTGGADLLPNNDAGWVIPAGCPDALRMCLATALESGERLALMRPAARAIAERHPWATFRRNLCKVLGEHAAD